MPHLIVREEEATQQLDVVMELLCDIEKALNSVARDFLPAHFTTAIQRRPPCLVLRVPGATNKALEAALYELASSAKTTFERLVPSMPLQYKVIGGSEVAGIEITPQPGSDPHYPYFHVVRASDLRNVRLTDFGQQRGALP